MKLAILSDLHLDIHDWCPREEDFAGVDAVILAGDIHTGAKGVEWAQGRFRRSPLPVLYVPGNHEFYGHDFSLLRYELALADAKTEGVFVLDHNKVWKSPRSVRFLGTTLWTDYELPNEPEDREGSMDMARILMRDHMVIRNGAGPFTPEDAREEHQVSRHWLETELARPYDGKTVVVTHHLPHPDSIPERYAVNALNPAFASDLSSLFERHRIDLWIHGHTHTACNYTRSASHDGSKWAHPTRIVCNPRGYPGENAGEYRPMIVEV